MGPWRVGRRGSGRGALWALERRLKKRNAEFQNTGGIPRFLAEFHGFSVNSTLLRDFQLLSPISTRYQVEFANSTQTANSNLKREFHVVWRRVVLVMWAVMCRLTG